MFVGAVVGTVVIGALVLLGLFLFGDSIFDDDEMTCTEYREQVADGSGQDQRDIRNGTNPCVYDENPR